MALGTTHLVANYVTSGSASIVDARTSLAVGTNPQQNLLMKDRAARTIFVASYASNVYEVGVAVDLGSVKSLNVFGVLGLMAPDQTQPAQIQVSVALTYPNPVVTGCTVSTAGTITSAVPFPSTVKVGQNVTWAGLGVATYVTGMNAPLGSATSLTVSPAPASTQSNVTVTFSDETQVVMPSALIGAGKPDRYVLCNPINARYVFFTFPGWPNGLATLSTVLAGSATDLGIAYASGSSETKLLGRVSNRAADGRLVATRVGRDRTQLAYSFPKVTSTTKDALESAVSSAPFLIVSPSSALYEVDVPSMSIQSTTVWGSPPLYDVALEAESLP